MKEGAVLQRVDMKNKLVLHLIPQADENLASTHREATRISENVTFLKSAKQYERFYCTDE